MRGAWKDKEQVEPWQRKKTMMNISGRPMRPEAMHTRRGRTAGEWGARFGVAEWSFALLDLVRVGVNCGVRDGDLEHSKSHTNSSAPRKVSKHVTEGVLEWMLWHWMHGDGSRGGGALGDPRKGTRKQGSTRWSMPPQG